MQEASDCPDTSSTAAHKNKWNGSSLDVLPMPARRTALAEMRPAELKRGLWRLLKGFKIKSQNDRCMNYDGPPCISEDNPQLIKCLLIKSVLCSLRHANARWSPFYMTYERVRSAFRDI